MAFRSRMRPLQVKAWALRPLRVGMTQSNMSTPRSTAWRMSRGSPTPMRYRGLWRGRPEEVATVGVPAAELAVKDFALPGKYLDRSGLGRAHFLADGPRSFMRSGFNRRPRPKVGRCTVCKACAQACPGNAIEMDKETRVAVVDDDKCIQCFCCHEVCPNAAIDLEFTGMGKVMHGLGLV